MTIQLHYDDLSAIAAKVRDAINANGESRSCFDVRVERYGIALKATVMKYEDHYSVEEIAFYGVNTNNVMVTYDYDALERYGRIAS